MKRTLAWTARITIIALGLWLLLGAVAAFANEPKPFEDRRVVCPVFRLIWWQWPLIWTENEDAGGVG